MKLIKRLTLVLLLAIAFTSCNKDDDNNSTPSLVGTWKMTAEKVNSIPLALDACELKSTLKFTDTKITSAEYEGTNCEDIYTETYSYTRNGNTITITEDGETMQIEISKLTSTILEITQIDDEESNTYVTTYTRQ